MYDPRIGWPLGRRPTPIYRKGRLSALNVRGSLNGTPSLGQGCGGLVGPSEHVSLGCQSANLLGNKHWSRLPLLFRCSRKPSSQSLCRLLERRGFGRSLSARFGCARPNTFKTELSSSKNSWIPVAHHLASRRRAKRI